MPLPPLQNSSCYSSSPLEKSRGIPLHYGVGASGHINQAGGLRVCSNGGKSVSDTGGGGEVWFQTGGWWSLSTRRFVKRQLNSRFTRLVLKMQTLPRMCGWPATVLTPNFCDEWLFLHILLADVLSGLLLFIITLAACCHIITHNVTSAVLHFHGSFQKKDMKNNVKDNSIKSAFHGESTLVLCSLSQPQLCQCQDTVDIYMKSSYPYSNARF